MGIKLVTKKVLVSFTLAVTYIFCLLYDFNMMQISYSSIIGTDWAYITFFSLYIIYISIFSLANMKDFIFCRTKHKGKAIWFVSEFLCYDNFIYTIVVTAVIFGYLFIETNLFMIKYISIFFVSFFMAVTLIGYLIVVIQIYYTKSIALILGFVFILLNLVVKMSWFVYMSLQLGDNYYLKPLYYISRGGTDYNDIIEISFITFIWLIGITLFERILRIVKKN